MAWLRVKRFGLVALVVAAYFAVLMTSLPPDAYLLVVWVAVAAAILIALGPKAQASGELGRPALRIDVPRRGQCASQTLEIRPSNVWIQAGPLKAPSSVIAQRIDLRRDLRVDGALGLRSISIGRKDGGRLTLLEGLSEEEASRHLFNLKKHLLVAPVPPPIPAAARAIRKARGVRISHSSDSYRGPRGLLIEVDAEPKTRGTLWGSRVAAAAEPTSQRVRIDEQIHRLVDGEEIHLGPSAGASLRVERDNGIHVRVELADGSEHALLVELSEDQLRVLEPELRKRLNASKA